MLLTQVGYLRLDGIKSCIAAAEVFYSPTPEAYYVSVHFSKPSSPDKHSRKSNALYSTTH